jgi:hypothetical protein
MRTQITVDWKDELYQELIRGTRESIRRGIALGVFDIHPLNRYFQRLIRQNVQQQRCLLTNASDFTELDHAGKRRLLTMIRHYINRAAIADMWSDFFLSFMRWINILVIVILCYFAFTGDYFPWFAPPLFSIDPAWPITYYFVLVLVANIGLLLSLLPTYMLKPMHPINLNLPLDLDVYINLSFHFWFNRGFMIGWYIGVATASAALYAVLAPIAETAPPFFRSQAFAGAVGGLGFLGGFLSIILVTALSVGRLFSLLNYAFERRKQRLYPEAAITLQLLKILTLVAKNPVMWGSLEMKCKLVTRLERVASCLQHDLPHRLQSDIATDNWFQQMGVQMATAMRALKPWVLMPKSDTRE